MSVPQSVATILKEHVTLEVESFDRLYLNVYVPTLQRVPGVLSFFRDHRGQPIASSALMAPISATFVAAIKAFVEQEGVPSSTSNAASARTISPRRTSRGSTRTRVSCSSAGPRRR